MIIRNRPRFWELIGVWRLSILPRIAPQLVCIVAWSCLVVWTSNRYTGLLRAWTVTPFTLLGVALSMFLSFRNSACYDRWWEARRQLGALVAETRSFARICVSLPKVDLAMREALLADTTTFTSQLMDSLRRRVSLSGTRTQNTPDFILRSLGRRTAELLEKGAIGEQLYMLIEERLIAFAGIQAACERVQTTPTPFTYALLVDRTVYAYCFLLPFGLAGSMGWATPFFATLVAYAFFGLDALGDELEDPFGDHVNALPLSALARTIEISMFEALGADLIPDPLQPVDSVLT